MQPLPGICRGYLLEVARPVRGNRHG